MSKQSGTWELIEIDPATGEEDQLLDEGSRAEMEKHLADILEDEAGEAEDGELVAPGVYRIQPATV